MKSMLIGGLAAVALTGAAFAQQASPDASAAKPAATTAAPAMSADAGSFIDKQQTGLLRAPKLVGVNVYDKDNKDVGKISDLLVDKDGSIKAVVIGVGGFLGIGSKNVAVPYSEIQWQTEQRTVATNDATAPGAGAGMNGTANTANGNTANNGDLATKTTNGAPANAANTKTIDAAQAETYQGYPDRAVIAMTQAQLKSAPDFKYASNPMNTGAATDTTAPATKP